MDILNTTDGAYPAIDSGGDIRDGAWVAQATSLVQMRSWVQSRRNAVAAKKFFRRLLKGLRYVPRVLVTDKLGSYQVAHRAVMPSVEHRRSRYLIIHTEFAGARPSPR